MTTRRVLVLGLAAAGLGLAALTAGMSAMATGSTPPAFGSISPMMNRSSSFAHNNATALSGGGMMGYGSTPASTSGHATIDSIAAARARVAAAIAGSGLHSGEVIWFSNGFYVELKDAHGNPTTEVLVNPNTGAVMTEPGPAMMWNTSRGAGRMMGGPTTNAITQVQARTIAQQWLKANKPGATVMALDKYPGYFTVDFTVHGTLSGMLSVNAYSGQVWFHTWHGRFIAREDS